jgi:hypothetical protein
MTTGTIDVSRSVQTDEFFHKSWDGADGKYTAGHVDKWNPYSMHLVMESFQYGQTLNAASTISNNVLMSWDTSDELQLQSKIVEAVKGHQFNLAVNLAQADQLIEMVSTTVQKFGRSLLALKRGDVATAARQLGIRRHVSKLHSKDISGRWLELQYGWLPSLSDTYEAAKAFEALSNGRKARIVVAHGKKQKIDRSAAPSLYSSEGVHFLVKKVIIELDEEISLARSLGLTDPLSVLWEITPYSFVADWFLPIGTYLSNLNVIPKLSGRFCSTLFSRWDTRFTLAKSPAYIGTRRWGHGRDVTRVISSSLTTQTPSFVNPITALSLRRIASSVALFHQAIK